MSDIRPLESTTRQAAECREPSHQFVLKTRAWVAISIAIINRPQKIHITAQAIPTPIGIAKPHPTTGVHGEHPKTKVRGRSSSYTWEAKEVGPTAGSRQP